MTSAEALLMWIVLIGLALIVAILIMLLPVRLHIRVRRDDDKR